MTSNHASLIEKALQHLGNLEQAEKSKRFFKTNPGDYACDDRFIGISMPVLRSQAKQYKHIALDTAADLLTSPFHEIRLFALIVMTHQFKQSTPENKAAIYQTYINHTQYINNWDLVDASAHLIVGPFLEHKHDKHLLTLATSKNMWERRIAMLSTLHEIRQGKFERAINIAEQLVNDKEDLIHKAVGWMLREIGKRNIEEEIRFLNRHYRAMPRTTLRYAIEKFPESLRQDYLKGRVS